MAIATKNGKQAKSSPPGNNPERLSPATENYLLCLYKMREDLEFPNVTQLTD